jgi:hypothetical protein
MKDPCPCGPGALTRRCERLNAGIIFSPQGICTIEGRGEGEAHLPSLANNAIHFARLTNFAVRRPASKPARLISDIGHRHSFGLKFDAWMFSEVWSLNVEVSPETWLS